MKTRTSFVANSSSSSFVIISKEEGFDKAIKAIKNKEAKDYFTSIKKHSGQVSMLGLTDVFVGSGEWRSEDCSVEDYDEWEKIKDKFVEDIIKGGGYADWGSY